MAGCMCFSALARAIGMGPGNSRRAMKTKTPLSDEELQKVVSPSSVAKHSSRNNISYSARYRYRAFMDDFDLDPTAILGQGINGHVCLATQKGSGDHFAIKSFAKRSLTKKQRDDLRREVEVYLALDHPHVARLEYVYEEAGEVKLTMEMLRGGEVHNRLSDRGVYSEEAAANAVHQMLSAVGYLHSHGLVHRDIKLSNFLYVSKDSDELKLIDFGFAKYWDAARPLLTRACGTAEFVAPEVLEHAYSAKADIWSVAICTYMLLTDCVPFPGRTMEQVFQKIVNREIEWCPAFFVLSEQAQGFVRALMDLNPEKRPTAAEALELEWVQRRWQHHSDGKALDRDTLQSFRSFANASSFRKAMLSIMAWSLTATDRKELEDQFKALDISDSGTITLRDFKEALREHFVDGTEAQALFEKIDADHDAELSYSEFLAAALASRQDPEEGLLRRTFGRLDADSSGRISTQDLRQVLGDSFDGVAVEELLEEADGSNTGELSFPQFLAWARGAPEQSQRQTVILGAMMRNISSDPSYKMATPSAESLSTDATSISSMGVSSASISTVATTASQDLMEACEASVASS